MDEKRSPCDDETSLMRCWLCVRRLEALIIRNTLFLVHHGPQIKTKTAHDFGNSILKKNIKKSEIEVVTDFTKVLFTNPYT